MWYTQNHPESPAEPPLISRQKENVHLAPPERSGFAYPGLLLCCAGVALRWLPGPQHRRLVVVVAAAVVAVVADIAPGLLSWSREEAWQGLSGQGREGGERLTNRETRTWRRAREYECVRAFFNSIARANRLANWTTSALVRASGCVRARVHSRKGNIVLAFAEVFTGTFWRVCSTHRSIPTDRFPLQRGKERKPGELHVNPRGVEMFIFQAGADPFKTSCTLFQNIS